MSQYFRSKNSVNKNFSVLRDGSAVKSAVSQADSRCPHDWHLRSFLRCSV